MCLVCPACLWGVGPFWQTAVKEGGARESCEWAMGRGSGGAQLSKASGRGKREAGGIKWEQVGASGIKWDQMGTRSLPTWLSLVDSWW